ncbi:hypothetical protein NL676_012285 [Syzygium grande]|nr:hypothetical protein NL676_012285 [Syzygium grande]
MSSMTNGTWTNMKGPRGHDRRSDPHLEFILPEADDGGLDMGDLSASTMSKGFERKQSRSAGSSDERHCRKFTGVLIAKAKKELKRAGDMPSDDVW